MHPRFLPLALIIAFALPFVSAPTRAQTPATPGADAALIDDIVTGSRVLADFGVLDGFGHVSARDPNNPNHFLMSRSLAPALVTSDDIMAFDLDGNAVDARGRSLFLERFIHSEIYKARPDVMAVVHTHSPGVVPFTVSQVLCGRSITMRRFWRPARRCGTSLRILAPPTCWCATPPSANLWRKPSATNRWS
jgi:hypothetical protein